MKLAMQMLWVVAAGILNAAAILGTEISLEEIGAQSDAKWIVMSYGINSTLYPLVFSVTAAAAGALAFLLSCASARLYSARCGLCWKVFAAAAYCLPMCVVLVPGTLCMCGSPFGLAHYGVPVFAEIAIGLILAPVASPSAAMPPIAGIVFAAWQMRKSPAAATLENTAKAALICASIIPAVSLAAFAASSLVPAPENAAQTEEDTPLIKAVKSGGPNFEKVKELLDAGEDPNGKGVCGKTPLMCAFRSDNWKEIAQLLLDRGANIDARDEWGNSALMYSLKRADAANFLIGKGADINAKDNEGASSIMMSLSVKDDTRAFYALLSGGADIRLKDKKGMDIIMRALSKYGRVNGEIIDYLLDEMGDVSARDSNGNTYLMMAARLGMAEFAERLAAKGADVNAQNKNGETALMLAADNSETIGILLDAGADIGIREKSGMTALLFFAKNCGENHDEAINALMARGAGTGDSDNSGNNAVMLCMQNTYGFDEMAENIKFLKEKGFDINAKNNRKETPLDWFDRFNASGGWKPRSGKDFDFRKSPSENKAPPEYAAEIRKKLVRLGLKNGKDIL